jgi:small-conductance mechanosensitive channel
VAKEGMYFLFDTSLADNIRQRRLRTQIDFLYRITLLIITVVGLASILMTFDGARRLGTSLIASAGLASVVIGFAAQRSLSNLIAGFQIAFTQPIRLDDVVIVEKEWGRVEEITLTYVVVRLWDLRRMILPLNYFIEKPFENWTRISADILGYFYLYADYTVSTEMLRTELEKLAQQSPLWDRRTCLLQVTDFTEQTVQLRILVSARNASDAFDLRCYLREGLLQFLQPSAFPKRRFEGSESSSRLT